MLSLARLSALPLRIAVSARWASAGHGHGHKAAKPGPTGVFPTNEAQATGVEAHELHGLGAAEHAELSKKVIASQSAEHWGTKDKPVLVLSATDHRLVGCTGSQCSSIHENSVLWWKLNAGPQHECPCGQVFQLVARPDGLRIN